MDSDKIIFNYSSRNLSDTEIQLLSRGLKFCLPPKKVNKNVVKCSFEMLYREINKATSSSYENKDRFKTTLKELSYSYIYDYDFSKQKKILSNEEWSALNDLRNDPTIIITKPDKGNGVVIVDAKDYITKMSNIISDSSKFKKINEDPTKRRETKLQNYLSKLKKNNFITEDVYS